MSKFAVKETKTGIKFSLVANNGEIVADSEVYKSKASCMNGIASVQKNAPIAPTLDLTDDAAKKVLNPKFEIYKDKAGEFRFRLKAKNGQIIATSEGYKTKASCVNGIESVKKNAPVAEIKAEK